MFSKDNLWNTLFSRLYIRMKWIFRHVLTYILWAKKKTSIYRFYTCLSIVEFTSALLNNHHIINHKKKLFVVQKREIDDNFEYFTSNFVHPKSFLYCVGVHQKENINNIGKKIYFNNHFQFTFLFHFMLSSTFFIQR